MKIANLLFIVFLLGLNACSKKELPIIDPNPIDEKLINLSNLKDGQKSIYIKYETTCENRQTDFVYTGDTLIVEVVETDSGMVLQESYTIHSPLYSLHDDNQNPKIIPVESKDKMLLLPERWTSNLFYFYGNDTLQVDPTHSTIIKQDGCYLMQEENPFIGNDIAWLDRLEVGDIVQENKTAVSCVPFFELDAYLIYDKHQLYQSHAISFVTLNGEVLEDLTSGWILLE